MKCPFCEKSVTHDDMKCPACGDHLGQWVEADIAAEQLRRRGIQAAEHGETHKALLCLVEASVIQPQEPASLRALGEVLVECGDYDSGTYYLNRCISVAERNNMPDELRLAKESLVRAEQQVSRPGSLLLGLESMPRALSQESKSTQTSEPDSWQLVTDVDRSWTRQLALLRPMLDLLRPKEKEHVGPYTYLNGLLSLAEDDIEKATQCFQQSVEADSSHRNADIYLLCINAVPEKARGAVEFLLRHGRTAEDVMETVLQVAQIFALRNADAEHTTLIQKSVDVIAEVNADERSASSLYLLAKMLLEIENISEAAKCLREAARLEPDRADVQELLKELSELGAEETKTESED